jgi:hypothetical protein
MDDPLETKKPEDMTRTELKIMATRKKPIFPSNPYHERLFNLEEQDRAENETTQQTIRKKTIGIHKMTIAILILSAIAVIIGIVALLK